MKRFFIFLIVICFSANVFAQITKQQAADLVLNTIVGNKIDSVNVFVEPNIQSSDFYVISPIDSINVPYDNYWFFFIDEDPEYYWGHDCNYVFVNTENGTYSLYEKQIPPFLYLSFMDDVSISYPIRNSITNYNIDNRNDYIPTPEANVNDGKYAVLLNGGDNYNQIYFWNDISHNYAALIEHGYPKENIFVLSCDGNSMSYGGANPSMDLDGDGDTDIIEKTCTYSNIEDILEHLSDIMKESDMLYFHSISHGYKDENTDNVYLCLWENEALWDYQLAEMLSGISCSQIIINVWACYSGGVTDDIMLIDNDVKKTILTCVDADNPVFRLTIINDSIKMDQCAYLTGTALRGWHPNTNIDNAPWERCYKIGELPSFSDIFNSKVEYDFDSVIHGGNNNGIYEIGEVINYTKQYDDQFNRLGTKINNCGFREDLLCLHGITGNIVNSQNIQGDFHIEDQLNINPNVSLSLSDSTSLYLFGADMTISESANLSLGNSTSIVAKSGICNIYIDGTISNGNNSVVFMAEDGATLNVFFNCENPSLNNITFDNCQLSFPDDNVSISNCNFYSTPLDLNISDVIYTGQSVTINNCSFYPESKNLNYAVNISGYGLYYVSNCNITKSVNDTGYFRNGIQIYYCGNSNSAIKSIYNNTINYCNGTGLMVYNSIGDIVMNKIHDNNNGVKLLNNSTINKFMGNSNASRPLNTQYIHDNDSYEIYMTRSCKPQEFHYNAISDDDNQAYIYYDPYVFFVNLNGSAIRVIDTIDVSYNWWNTTDSTLIASRLRSNSSSAKYMFMPLWQMGISKEKNTADEILLAEANEYVENGNYSEAKAIYMQIVEEYPTTTSAETSLKTMLTIEMEINNNYASLKNYYNTNQVIASNDRLRVLASSLANKCNEFDGNYEEAVTWYEDVLTSPQTSYNDSIFASIDLGNLYLKMESNGEKMNCGKLNEHKPKSYQQYLKQTNYALSLLPQQDYVNIEQIDDENNPVQNLNSMQNHLGYMMLTWDIPQNTNYDEKLLSWSNDIFYTACAVGVYEEQEALHYFTSDDISDYVGWRIKQIAFIPLGTENTHSIVIWEAFDEEKTLVYEQEIGNENLVFGEWNYIDLNDDFYFENDKNYYIGFSSDGHSNGHFIFPADNGEPNYGKNWIHIGESQWHCFDEAASYNLCIKTILENQDGKVINVDNSKNNKLTGYRVYANNEIVKEIKEPYITCYFDTEFESVNDIRYCVTAVYGDVESEPLCVKYVSVDEIAENSSTLNVHPNPTNGRIIIEKLNVSSVEIYNTQGQSVGRFNTNEIDMENLPSGMYFLVVKDRDGNINVGKVVRE